MKLVTLTILMLCITFSIIIFDQTQYINPDTGEMSFYNISTDIAKDQTSTKWWDFFLNPVNWSKENGIVSYIIVGIVGLLLLGSLTAIATRAYAPDTYIFAILYVGLIGLGAIPTILLYNFINNRLSAMLCTGGGFCFFPNMIAVLIAGSLAFTWIMKCISTWRTGQE